MASGKRRRGAELVAEVTTQEEAQVCGSFLTKPVC